MFIILIIFNVLEHFQIRSLKIPPTEATTLFYTSSEINSCIKSSRSPLNQFIKSVLQFLKYKAFWKKRIYTQSLAFGVTIMQELNYEILKFPTKIEQLDWHIIFSL